MSRTQRLVLLHRWRLQQFAGDHERVTEAWIGDTNLLTDAESEWHEVLQGFASALVGIESRKRWAVCRSTESDYAATVVKSIDGLLVQESKLMASEPSAGEV